jgi:glutamate/tyrosine decarboxylase-like PLP-dependent enzyme
MTPLDESPDGGALPLEIAPEEFRRLGERLVAALADYQSGLRGRAARPPESAELGRAILGQPLPEAGASPDEIIDFVTRDMIPHAFGNDHPRFFGWIVGPSAPIGALAEFAANTTNTPTGGASIVPLSLERCVTRWLMELIGYPTDGSMGLLVSGGSVANLTALAVARYWAAKADGWDLRREGFQGGRPRYMVYATTEAHSCVRKSVELLGLGTDSLAEVPLDAERRMDLRALAEAVAADRAAGRRPFCVVASAGTVNVGAVDPIAAIADFCAAEDLWLHVDGAYGWIGGIDPEKAPLYEGIERAQSVALDPHKWLCVPIECGCTLVRDGRLQREAFSHVAPYLQIDQKIDEAALPWPMEFGIQLTRSFRALKTWATLSHLGRQGAREIVTRHNRLARRLADAIEAAPDLELTAPVTLSVVCFRYQPPGWQGGEAALDALNRRINDRINEAGRIFFTPTELDGRYVLRACFIHYATRTPDVDAIIEEVRRWGSELAD